MLDTIVLADDRRGAATAAARWLPLDNFISVSRRLLDCHRVMISTGFAVQGRQETDGPPGALALAAALNKLGIEVGWACGAECWRLLQAGGAVAAASFSFPISSEAVSTGLALHILSEFRPDCLISVECCGRTSSGHYLNMRGEEIDATTPKLDALFLAAGAQRIWTIGIGDGGNEIGFGLVDPALLRAAGIEPCVVRTDALIVAAVSNWGAYGLVAALSVRAEIDLLPAAERQSHLIQRMVRLGAVDGLSGRPQERVDGFSLADNERLLRRLRDYVADALRT